MDRRLAEKIISFSHDLNCIAAEVYLRAYTSSSVEVKDQKVDALDRADDTGAGLRVLVGGRMGFSFTTDLSDAAVSKLVHSAVTNALNTEPDPFFALPVTRQPVSSVAIYDEQIARLTESEMISRVMAMERSAYAADPRIKRIRKASASFSRAHTLIMNTSGADIEYESTACSSGIEVVAEEKGESQAGSDFEVARFSEKLRMEEVGRKAAIRALDLLGARTVKSCKAPVVLESDVARDFLSMMAGGFSAENVQKKRSLLIGKQGHQICSSRITIYDDGLLEGGLGTAPADDEAVPAQKKIVINDGTLMLFLHNVYTAAKEGTASTGNGMRGGFKSVPGVGVSNLFIQPGEHSLKSLTEIAGNGLLVTEVMGMHTANPISGDFSVGATGFWIENGVKSYPVREATIAGNILDLMKSVEQVGSDLRFSGRIGSPSLLISNLSIAGR